MLVIVNKGTLEPKKRHCKLSLHQILQVVCFSGFKENFVNAESKFSSHLTKLFLARATQQERTCEHAKIIFKDVHYKRKNLAEESRYTVSLMHVRVALIFSCGKR